MTSTKRTIAILLTAILELSLLLTACAVSGGAPIGDNVTPGASSTPIATTEPPTTSPVPTHAETSSVIEAVTPEMGAVSTAGTYYKSGQCVYSLPGGMMCTGAEKNDALSVFTTIWAEGLRSHNGKMVIIMEHDEKVADFDKRTAEQWWQYCYIGQDISSVKNIKVENTTVDGYPAVRLTDEIENSDGSISHSESWAIDTPSGCIVFSPVNFEISHNYEEHSKWVADTIATVQVGHEVAEKPTETSPGSERNPGLFR